MFLFVPLSPPSCLIFNQADPTISPLVFSIFFIHLVLSLIQFHLPYLLNQDIIELLIKKGANQELTNNYGESVHTMSDVSEEIKSLLQKN